MNMKLVMLLFSLLFAETAAAPVYLEGATAGRLLQRPDPPPDPPPRRPRETPGPYPTPGPGPAPTPDFPPFPRPDIPYPGPITQLWSTWITNLWGWNRGHQFWG